MKEEHNRVSDSIPRRRARDRLQMGETVSDSLIEMIYEDMQIMKATMLCHTEKLERVAEIVSAWDNAKGFVKTVRIVGEVAKWLVVAGAAVTAIWYWVKRG